MAGQVDGTTLIRLLQKLAAVQGCFCDQSVVIFFSKPSGALQGPCQYAHSLELRSAIAYAILVDRESLDKEFISRFLEAALVSNLPAGDEETEAKFGSRWIYAGVELNEGLVEEAIEAGRLGGPIVFEVFARFVLARKLEQGGNEGRDCMPYPLVAGFIGFARLL